MAVSVHIIGLDGATTPHNAAAGEIFAVATDQRVELPDVTADQAVLATTEGDLLAVTVNGETIYFAELISHIENETGAEILFSDGQAIATLGELLARAGSGMADLVDNLGEVGDLFDLGIGGLMESAAPFSVTSDGHALTTADLLETASDGDGSVPGLEKDEPEFEPGDGLWAGTEAAKSSTTWSADAVMIHPDDEFDGVVGGVDDIIT